MILASEKKCGRCHVSKSLNEYAKGSANPDGLQRWCNMCRSSRRDELAGRLVITEKRCRSCRRVQDVRFFYRCRITRDGYQTRCKPCFKTDYGIGTDERNKRVANLRRSRWSSYILARCRARAAGLDVPFNLTVADLEIPSHCPVLGIPLVLAAGPKQHGTPSVDRKIPSLGYVSGNVLVISWRANRLKTDETDAAVFDKIAAYIRSFVV